MRWSLIAGLVGTLLLACADGAGGPPEFSHGEAVTPEEREAFWECMAQGGFPQDQLPPRPPFGEGPIPDDSIWVDPSFRNVKDRCVVKAGVGDVEGDEPEEVAQANQQARSITRCMRGKGWDVPDPVPEPRGRYLIPAPMFPPNDSEAAAAFNADLRECAGSLRIPIDP